MFGWVDVASVLIGTLAVIGRFVELHALLAPAKAPTLAMLQAAPPHEPPQGYGWWSWLDQHFYLESALAWAHGRLDPALHWYPPGYPLMGAAFARLTPTDPFMLPDLICVVGSLWLFAAIGGHLFGRAALGRSLGAWVFVATTALPKRVMSAWVIPWTTTPAALCLLACLFATIRMARRPSRGDAFLAGFAAAAAVAFRPADAAVVGGICAVASCCAIGLRWPGWRAAGGVVLAAVAGAAVPLLGFGAAYLAVDGLRADGYLLSSAGYGFEWRLLPLRWVILMIDPKPLFIDGQGLAQVFPWIVPGLVGMVALLLARRVSVPRFVHWAVVAAVMADVVQFLCYRDLHPDYLWQNGVYHYFKWTLPFFGLYAALLLQTLFLRRWLAACLAVAGVLLGLVPWRVAVVQPVTLPQPVDSARLLLPNGLSALNDLLFVRTQPGETAMLAEGTEIHAGDRSFHSTFDFKMTPWSETLMLQPLRGMPDTPSVLEFGPDTYSLNPAVAPVLAQVQTVWGLPCWVQPERPACQTGFLLPAPDLALGQAVRLGTGGDGEVYRLSGLATSEPGGDWTDGTHAALWFRTPVVQTPLTLDITAEGFAPVGDPVRVTAYVNGVAIGDWSFGRDTSTVRSTVPVAALRSDGNVLLDLVVADPRIPTHYSATSDTRELGIKIKGLRVAVD